MLDVQRSFHGTIFGTPKYREGSDSDKKMFKQKIDLIDRQIDTLVYGTIFGTPKYRWIFGTPKYRATAFCICKMR